MVTIEEALRENQKKNAAKAAARTENRSARWKKALNDDRFNDLTIFCNDGGKVRCLSHALRIASDVFDDMLSIEDKKIETLEAPKFSSNVMEEIKYYCYVGAVRSFKYSEQELHLVLELGVAADYYSIDHLGVKCADCVRQFLEKKPNYAFIVAAKFGPEHKEETRKHIASTMRFASTKIASFNRKALKDATIFWISSITDVETLRAIVGLIPTTVADPLLPFYFLEKWVSLSKSQKASEIAQTVARATKLLTKIGSACPSHLTDGKGPIRASSFVSAEMLMDALYELSPTWYIET